MIRSSIIPYSSLAWIVPKKIDASGKKKQRLVKDERKLNEKTIEDKYPFPRINNNLDNLEKCMYFTTLEVQIKIDENSIEKNSFYAR